MVREVLDIFEIIKVIVNDVGYILEVGKMLFWKVVYILIIGFEERLRLKIKKKFKLNVFFFCGLFFIVLECIVKLL